MFPSYKEGDLILVTKWGFPARIGKWEVSFLEGRVSRFDVLVLDGVEEELSLKRVVGLPGDYFRFENDRILINDGPLGGMASEGLYFQGRVYQAVNVGELNDLLKKYSLTKNQKSVPFEYFAYAKEYTDGMKNLKYDEKTKDGMVFYLNQFDPSEISKFQSIEVKDKKAIGNIEIIYGIYKN